MYLLIVPWSYGAGQIDQPSLEQGEAFSQDPILTDLDCVKSREPEVSESDFTCLFRVSSTWMLRRASLLSLAYTPCLQGLRSLSAMSIPVDKMYPGTAVDRMIASRERVAKLTSSDLNQVCANQHESVCEAGIWDGESVEDGRAVIPSFIVSCAPTAYHRTG